MKQYHLINCSIGLVNQLEEDHYNSARDYFTKMGPNEDSIRHAKDFFSNYDEAKEELIEDCKKDKMSESYVHYAAQFSSKRALEIIDAAAKDTKPKTDETESKNWRKARY